MAIAEQGLILPDSLSSPEKSTEPDVYFGICSGNYPLTTDEMGSWQARTKSGELLTASAIKQKTWIERRFVPDKSQNVLSMAVDASRKALKKWRENGGRGKKIDAVFFSTSYPTGQDFSLEIQERLDITADFHLNIHAGCSGGTLAFDFLKENEAEFSGKNILVVASENHSPYIQDLREKDAAIIDPALSHTIFSAGSAAMIFELGKGIKLLSSLHTDFPDVKGLDRNCIEMPYDKSLLRGNVLEIPVPVSKTGKIRQDGKAVFDLMRNRIPDLIKEVTAKAGLLPSDLDLGICHPGTGQLLGGIALRLGTFVDPAPPLEFNANKKYIANKGNDQRIFPPLYNDISDGNWSSAATIKIEMKASSEGRIKKKSKIVVAGFGVGPYAALYCAEFG